ncbi:MAG: response regulator [Lachnospiraceae bacterium]
MYNLLLLEDEGFTREGLLRHIDWEKYEISRVEAAANGQSAISLLDSFKPDILLSDIKMPHMNGVEFATVLRARYPHCKIIFLSGYADKEYLLSAIELKAECFIEKPVNIDQVTAAIETAVAHLKAEAFGQGANASVELDLYPLIQRQMLSALFKENLSWETFSEKYVPDYFSWLSTDTYRIACARFHHETRDLQQESLRSDVLSSINEVINFSNSEYFMDITDVNELIILFHSDDMNAIHGFMSMLQQILFVKFQIECVIGISKKITNISHVYTHYKNLSSLVIYQYFYFGRQSIFEEGVLLKEKLAPTALFNKRNFYLSGIEQLFSTIEKEKYTNIHKIRLQFYELYTLMMERTMNDNTMTWKRFETFSFKEYVDLITYGMNAYQILGNNLYDIKIKNAVHYILWNYQNPELSIQMIADHTDLSPNYLCTLFKKQTKSTINDFLNKVRLDKARILLEKTDLKLYEISEMTGITDSNYFSTLFKNEYGMSPSGYRRHNHATKRG